MSIDITQGWRKQIRRPDHDDATWYEYMIFCKCLPPFTSKQLPQYAHRTTLLLKFPLVLFVLVSSQMKTRVLFLSTPVARVLIRRNNFRFIPLRQLAAMAVKDSFRPFSFAPPPFGEFTLSPETSSQVELL
jgi:hypothetical protein